MMIVMKPGATPQQVENVISYVIDLGLTPHLEQGVENVFIGLLGQSYSIPVETLEALEGVQQVTRISQAFKLASRQFQSEDSVFPLAGYNVGGNDIILIAGPCAVESRSQIIETAQAVREAGANALRGGVFKPRTSPYAFQGLGEQGLEFLAEAGQATGMPVVAEIVSETQLEVMLKYVDVLQIGARNMQNFYLLSAVGQVRTPVLLKRGPAATIEEFLMSAEYILRGGNRHVILCERGIRTFETTTRNTTDINAIPALKALSHLPVILDPSHSTGLSEYVPAVARAAIAAGADGLIIEVHPDPPRALSDGRQSLTPEQFAELMHQIRAIAEAMSRKIARVGHNLSDGW